MRDTSHFHGVLDHVDGGMMRTCGIAVSQQDIMQPRRDPFTSRISLDFFEEQQREQERAQRERQECKERLQHEELEREAHEQQK